MPTVSCLRVAPVKALSTVRYERVVLDRDGVTEDRRLFLVYDDDSVATLRQHPELARVVPDLDPRGDKLTVTFPDGAVVTDALSSLGSPLHTQLFRKDRAGRVLAGEISAALSRFAGESLRVVLADSVGTGWDRGPISLIGASSSAEFAPAGSDAARFRMLMELAGTAPCEEDSWLGSRLAVGEAVLRATKQVKRCVVTNRSPETGVDDANVLGELASKRGNDAVCLGIVADVLHPGAVSVGDEVRVEPD